MKRFFLIMFSALIFGQTVQSQSNFKFSGITYFDYFYNIGRNQGKISEKDQQGFQFRRVFFTADFDISSKLAARFRLESDGASFTNNSKFAPYLKEAYVQYKLNSASFFAGLLTTPPIEIEEKYWGYRSVEKIQADLRGVVSTRDMGIAVRGSFDDKQSSNYWLMFGNNSSHGPELNKYKRIYAQFNQQLYDNFVTAIDLSFANNSNDKNILLGKLGLYYQQKASFSVGASLLYQSWQKVLAGDKNLNSIGISTFGNVNINDELAALLRVDYWDPNSNSQSKNDSEFSVIAGIDYKLEPNFSIIPNVSFNIYELSGVDPDITGKVTFYWKF